MRDLSVQWFSGVAGWPMRGIVPKPCDGGAPLRCGRESGRAFRIDEISDLGACFVQRATHSQSFDASRLRPATTTSRWASRQSPRCASNAPIPRAAQTEHRVHVVHDVVGDDRVYRPGHLRHPLCQRLRRWRNDARSAKFMSSPEWSLMGQAGTGQPPTRGAHGRVGVAIGIVGVVFGPRRGEQDGRYPRQPECPLRSHATTIANKC
jgi:hypothetical protein